MNLFVDVVNDMVQENYADLVYDTNRVNVLALISFMSMILFVDKVTFNNYLFMHILTVHIGSIFMAKDHKLTAQCLIIVL